MNKLIVNGMLLGSLLACSASAGAVDFEYFKSQSCKDLGKEYVQLAKAEQATADERQKNEDKASRDKAIGIASAFLLGFGWWSSADHSKTDQVAAEIRSDKKMVTRAAQMKKCRLPEV